MKHEKAMFAVVKLVLAKWREREIYSPSTMYIKQVAREGL